ncbi:oligomeric golgi complex component, COG2-domain-containing protein [Exophiala viscosa]|uniref:oligomeric golgi complex component, COG2-domain-containing protein n=1 Tax=Exophiala viscosa TaxID=2486360 RepID=UPI002191BEFB|nr:oligomeric golgi complex component, COG2-domain-containing protein [Exophiala viscosa]
MSSRFYFGGSDSGSDIDDNDAALPFPKPLDRSSFLAPDFDATAFLSGLSNRFQTLEDLQTELRELSQTLNKELVDLVNDNYQDFLSLGSTLSGGEDKIEEIRLGLLGFQRDVQAVRDKVEARRYEIAELLNQKKALKRETGVGRSLLEIAERLDLLEEKLKLARGRSAKSEKTDIQEIGNAQWREDWLESATNERADEYEVDDTGGFPPKLRRRIEEYLIVKHLSSRHSPRHPFILTQDSRLRNIQEVLLSDLEAAIKREPEIKMKQQLLQIRAAVEG